MANLSVNLCGVEFKNPVISASGTYGFGREFNELYPIGVIGGISTKGLTLEPRLGNPTPRIAESRGVILNAVGLQNPGVEHFIEQDLSWLKSTGTCVKRRTFWTLHRSWTESRRPCPADRGRESPWAAPSSETRRSSSWTNLFQTWTRSCATR